MKVRFWGTRGSIPIALTAQQVRAKIVQALRGAVGRTLDSADSIEAFVDSLDFSIAGTFGGHSSCVELDTGMDNAHIILDLGSGARPLGQDLVARQRASPPRTCHVFMSHLHWDHIMGLPFFAPVYIPGNHIVIHGCHAALESAFRRQQAAPSFPVDFSQLAARIEFDVLKPDCDYEIAGMTVRAKLQRHEGNSYGWRFEHGGKVLVYSTDSEHRVEDLAERTGFTEFFRDADLVIFDAMYSLADAISVKADWGHSSNLVGIEICHQANAKRLALFHHEPVHDDARIAATLAESRRYEALDREQQPLEVISAYDTLEICL